MQYRLAPVIDWLRPHPRRAGGDRFPAALDDVIAAVTTQGEPYALGGPSAGACLAASAAILATSNTPSSAGAACTRVRHVPRALPTVQPELRKGESGRHALGQFTPRAAQIMNDNYVGADARFAPEGAFPGDAPSLSNLPSILLLDADRDVLRACGARFGDQLREAWSTGRSVRGSREPSRLP
ncbi:alpha/beta hydrolase fold domain-containing protein [Curtobacterium flaccumfaciens]|uniref:alpha/beta hydrolase fold domain-containing protein n=1 Tax=Curtobacterium flaccumfaciens TaxID=2035 RepID=UPI0034A0D0A3